MSAKVVRCQRCNRRWRGAASGWNVVFAKGYAVGFLCPTCQTPEENAEAEVNDATRDYSRSWVDAQGRSWVMPKGDDEAVTS